MASLRLVRVVLGLSWLLGAITTSCTLGADRRNALGNEDAGDDLSDAGSDGPVIDPDGGTCHDGPPPAGAQCSCAFSDCPGCRLRCLCHIACYEERDDCLIVVDDGAVKTADPVLSKWELACTAQNPGGEAPYLVCDGKKDPCVPDPDAGPPDAGKDTGTDADDDGGSDPKCPVPVPGKFTLVEPVWGEFGVDYQVPFTAYAFAVAHAFRMLERASFGLVLRPSLFLATALKESFMGCSNELEPWMPGVTGIVYRGQSQHVDVDGCFQLESTTAWSEMCRMFDDELDCVLGHAGLISSKDQDALGRDNFVSSTLSAAYYHAFSFSFFQLKEKIQDPFSWLASASDPLATPKLAAALYNRGAWSGAASRIFTVCHERLIEECEPGALDYVRQVGAYVREMEGEIARKNCYDEPTALADIDDYVSQLLPLFDDEDEASVREAARSAFLTASQGAETATFQRVALEVVSAIEARLRARVHCPEDELNEFYVPWGGPRWTCPK